MALNLGRAREGIDRTLWEPVDSRRGRVRRGGVNLARLVYKLVGEFRQGEIPVRAASLVYTTILTFVPILALAFSVLKALGVHGMMHPFLLKVLEPMGEKGEDLALSIVLFVDNVQVGVLGIVGLALLLYTVISSIQQIEGAFNYIWGIARPRTFLNKFRDYLSVMLAGPLLMVSAVGITTTVMSQAVVKKLHSIEPFGTLLTLISQMIPYGLIFLSFTLLYFLLPNTKVRFRSALTGGIVAGLLWQTGGWAFTAFVMSSTQYSAIYKGFAIILLFMVWLYYSWLILLTGAKIAFYHQYSVLLGLRDEGALLCERGEERIALLIMYLVGSSFVDGGPRWTVGMLIRRLKIPLRYLQTIIDGLVGRGILLYLPDENAYLPARDLSAIRISDILRAVRHDPTAYLSPRGKGGAEEEIDALLSRVDAVALGSIESETLTELISAIRKGSAS